MCVTLSLICIRRGEIEDEIADPRDGEGGEIRDGKMHVCFSVLALGQHKSSQQLYLVPSTRMIVTYNHGRKRTGHRCRRWWQDEITLNTEKRRGDLRFLGNWEGRDGQVVSFAPS